MLLYRVQIRNQRPRKIWELRKNVNDSFFVWEIDVSALLIFQLRAFHEISCPNFHELSAVREARTEPVESGNKSVVLDIVTRHYWHRMDLNPGEWLYYWMNIRITLNY